MRSSPVKISPILATVAATSLSCAGFVRADAPAAADPRAMSLTCATCHWIESAGPAIEDGIPSLHGRTESELLKKLREYRAGVGDPTIMNRIARGFTDEQLAAIAHTIAGAGREPGKTP